MLCRIAPIYRRPRFITGHCNKDDLWRRNVSAIAVGVPGTVGGDECAAAIHRRQCVSARIRHRVKYRSLVRRIRRKLYSGLDRGGAVCALGVCTVILFALRPAVVRKSRVSGHIIEEFVWMKFGKCVLPGITRPQVSSLWIQGERQCISNPNRATGHVCPVQVHLFDRRECWVAFRTGITRGTDACVERAGGYGDVRRQMIACDLCAQARNLCDASRSSIAVAVRNRIDAVRCADKDRARGPVECDTPWFGIADRSENDRRAGRSGTVRVRNDVDVRRSRSDEKIAVWKFGKAAGQRDTRESLYLQTRGDGKTRRDNGRGPQSRVRDSGSAA